MFDIVAVATTLYIGIFLIGIAVGAKLERNWNTKVGTPSASHNRQIAPCGQAAKSWDELNCPYKIPCERVSKL